MRLDSEILSPDPLPAPLVQVLSNLGIRTTTDLLFDRDASRDSSSGHSPIQFRAVNLYGRLPSGTISLRDLERSLSHVLERVATPGVSASDLQKQDRAYVTSFPALNKILDQESSRGFLMSHVYEISGDRGAGKSTLVLNTALGHLLSECSEVLWIDTTGDFAVDRALETLRVMNEERQHPPSSTMDLDSDPFAPSPPSSESIMGEVLARLHVSVAFDIQTIYEILDSLGLFLDSDESYTPIKCIIIDSLTPLLSKHFSAVSAQGHAMMTAFMRHLKELAVKYGSVVFVVNNATLIDIKKPKTQNTGSSSNEGIAPNFPYRSRLNLLANKKPALGPSFVYMTDATLWLAEWKNSQEDGEDREPDTTLHVLEVLKSRVSSSNTWCKFKIRGGMIV